MCVTSENKTTSSDISYTDVVIIGNGPSGICLSYMLAGNWPYYTGEPHPGDEMLTARLHYCTQSTCNESSNINDRRREQCDSNNSNSDSTSNKSGCAAKGRRDTSRCLARITRNKLECLCTGLEGRGGARTLPLLMDQLQHPGVDAGLDVPSLLTWKSPEQQPEHKVIDHVVLGKGQPGGAWQTMDPNVLTISLSRWMSLPGLDLRHWEMLVKLQPSDDAALSQDIKIPYKTTSRVSVGTVAAYYKDYVTRQGLEKYFRCGTTVTSVRSIPKATNNSKESEYKWLVEGFENETGERFLYRCKRVVLATGTTDLSNHLPGEEPRYDWVTHNLNDIESKLDQLVAQHKDAEEGTLENRVDPVLIIGSGLSAADAIMAARFRGIPVLHAFRDTSNSRGKDKFNINFYDKLQLLPNSIYPEYHKVYEMMADGGTNYPLYKSLKDYSLVKLDPNERVVTLRDSNNQLHKFGVSVTGIFIGYKPDLSYLENNGVGLGKIPDKPIDSRSNPINIDNFTYEVLSSQPKGMYALGPLVGDNFVRYILGGAFGILVHILHSSTTTITTTATT